MYFGEFGKGNSVSQTAERTGYRGVRRLRERYLLRRERLHRVLHVLNFLPAHFDNQIDFDKRPGKFKNEAEPKIAYDEHGFVFKDSFAEMLADFKTQQPNLLLNKKGEPALVPYDWTLYYLRKKALTKKIERAELAWILLNFNQKRGYYQLRGEEEEEMPNKLVEFHSLKIVDVVADAPQPGKNEVWYSVHLENGWVYRRSSKIALYDWKDKTKDFIVTTDINEDGSYKTDKDGVVKRSFRAPGESDWTLVKKKTEKEIIHSNKTVGAYIYDALLQNPKQKIKGKLVRTIERKFYKEELRQILKAQIQFHAELQDTALYNDCVRELYRNNELHQTSLSKRDFLHLFLEDIIFYQRPLKSKKNTISNCPLEFRNVRGENGVTQIQSIQAIHKSNPYYQEFRLWQWIYNLSIYRIEDDLNVTQEFLSDVDGIVSLFSYLNCRREVEQHHVIEFLLMRKLDVKKVPKAEIQQYRWNYVADKKYPCNETYSLIATRLEKVDGVEKTFLTKEIEHKLWHIIYSVTDKIEFEKALNSFAAKHNLDKISFVEAFKKTAPFKNEYGSFSEKAIKKLLPLMRCGRYWNWDNIHEQVQERIQKIITGEYDATIKDKVRDKAINLTKEEYFQGIPLWLAQYIVYGRHSEAASTEKWNSANDIHWFLDVKNPDGFKQHSLRNPIVEQVVTETLRVVKDIWTKYGEGRKDFFNEIHIELGREMKNTADERADLTKRITENENTNLRVKSLLIEMLQDPDVANVRPYSPTQQEILKIFEEGVLNSDIEIAEDILKISKTAQPTSAELRRYKLWLEQKYRSPYTGEIIPLNKLFTPDYEIEHIIPQSRYFDDSMSNKVICEAAVNKLKDNCVGLEFIKEFHGSIVDCGLGKQVKVFEVDAYEAFVKQHYAKNRSKRNKLLLEDIPEKMIERQLNDTRYISKYISALLSKIVRVDTNDDGFNSKNVLPGNGKITTELKKDWGLHDVWNDLILPRFERLNQICNTSHFTTWNENYQKYLPTVPIELSRGFSKKRIDHRHHAMDALVIACATRDHVNLLNNQSANSDTKRYDLKRKLMRFEKVSYVDSRTGELITREVPKQFIKPWESFTVDAKTMIEHVVVSFKQNLRVINKATNYYEKWVEEDGLKEKKRVSQQGVNWAIRKAMHKETVSGKVILPRIKVPAGKIITATRKSLDISFDKSAIDSITDTGIQKILTNYLTAKAGNPEIAFSPEGIEDLNKNIAHYNDGKWHQPIYKVRVFEVGSKFAVGQFGNKKHKYVEAAKGTNLFFAVYADANNKRSFASIPLNEVIERQKQGLPPVPELNEKGHRLLFHLSPNDLVYVMTEEEIENRQENFMLRKGFIPAERIYKFVSCTGNEGHFVPMSYASPILKNEMGTNNKSQNIVNGQIQIKTFCAKLSIDRLGYVKLQ
ncbi:type II CRISPR RNA-guided endonuclease Cas9 [Phnomibacter ginsenosidimutans]|uniref:type II CRISPR RNA-guided endonuclease Cas9 n=1 Tax=Phnomibacter ginsenosidimutans TaxID=2676868 RepID=UPI00248456E7|nr:type II CRISPR RNA-guided endonuclease Cas9 [Phnomibacter ginsenosidimutans]